MGKFADELWNGIGDAIADIREKAVEEPWFGRVVTERGDAAEWPRAQEPQEVQPGEPTGEILPPEGDASNEPGAWPRIEHGTVLEGQAETIHEDTSRLEWPKAEGPQSSYTREMEPQRDMERDLDLDR